MTPPVDGAALRAAFEASCLRGALPPVDLPMTSMLDDVLVEVKARLCFVMVKLSCGWVERDSEMKTPQQYCDDDVREDSRAVCLVRAIANDLDDKFG